MLPRAARGIGGTRTIDIAATMHAKPMAARKRAGPEPTLAMRAPAMSGPTTRVPCHTMEFRATAFIRSLRAMRCG